MELTSRIITGKAEFPNHYKKSTSYRIGLHERMQVRVHLSYRDKSSDMYFFAHLEVLPLCVHQDARLLPLGQVKQFKK